MLTGATGSLGAFLVHQLATLPNDVVERIVCLVRADDDEAALWRVGSVLDKRGLDTPPPRYEALAADVSQKYLGLNEAKYHELLDSVDVVIHVSVIHFVCRRLLGIASC